MCSGFWVGLLISCFYDINPIMGASISSLFSWGASSVVESFNTLSVFLETYLEDGEETDERIVE